MGCFAPVRMYRSLLRDVNGKYTYENNLPARKNWVEMQRPCGYCDGCLIKRADGIAVRAHHEASLYFHNSFLTLTYNDENLPENSNLNLDHPKKFLKDLRSDVHYQLEKQGLTNEEISEKHFIRAYGCAEYGPKLGRPHYHLLIFNYGFPDKKPWRKSPSGEQLFLSEQLEKLWPYGFSSIGNISFASAAYVAQYTIKKFKREEDYEKINYETGEVIKLIKPQGICWPRGKRGGLGRPWLEKNMADVFPHDHVIIKGKEKRPPVYYDKMFEKHHPDQFFEIKLERFRKAIHHSKDNTPERLAVKKKCLQGKLKLTKRSYEDG